MKEFNIKEFKEEFNCSDLSGLEYLRDTIIKDYKEIIKENNKVSTEFIREEYITSLFNATMELNNCMFIYECTNVRNTFNYDLYTAVRDLLLKELGILEELENENNL